jgi:hypothetical protein
MNSLFLEGLESALRIVNDKGIEALTDLISELKVEQHERAVADHPAGMETR